MDKLGKYEILEKIGEGGFGAVYRARDPHLKRIVALKICSHDDPDLQRRFLREGEIVASLRHPHITLIHDLGFEGGIPFLVQEFLSGEDLAAIIRRRDEIDGATRIRWMLEIASGLEYAHQKGIVHRDIKPANIRILDDRSAKIMDFGIAKLAQHETRLTQVGSSLGTIAYMAPEQLDGREADHRSDIFAFGVLAYEVFAYSRPFDGETTSRIVYQILHEEPRRIESLSPQSEPGLDRILRLCLAKKPELRFQSFGAVREALERLQAGLPPIDDATEAGSRALAAATALLGTSSATGASRAASISPGGPRTGSGSPASGAGADVAPTEILGTVGEGTGKSTGKSAGKSAPSPSRRAWIVAGAVAAAVLVALVLWLFAGRRGGGPASASASETVTPAQPVAGAMEAPPSQGARVAEATVPSTAPGDRQNEVVTSLVERAERAAKSAMAAAEESGARELASSTFGAAERKLADGANAIRRHEPEAAVDAFSAAQTGFEASGREAARSRAAALAGEQRSAVAALPKVLPSTVAATSASQAPEPLPAEKEAPPAPPPVAPAAPIAPIVQTVTPAPSAESEIQHVLDAYVSAYEHLDAGAVVAAVPSLSSRRSDLDRAFSQYQSLDMQLERCRFEVSGASATATCDKRQTFEPKVGQGRSVTSKAVFRLALRGGQWVIESVEG